MTLRRLVVEFSAVELSKFVHGSLQYIDTMETVAFLRDTPEESAVICKVKFKEPSSKPKDIFSSTIEVHILEQVQKGVYTLLLKNKRRIFQGKSDIMNIGAYVSTPYEISNNRIKATFLGTVVQIKKLLQTFAKLRVEHRVVSLADARFPPDSPLGSLSDKQRKVLLTAYNLGYYDLPKRISSEELAQKLNMRSSTLVIHRIKAEKRLLDEILK